MPTVYPSEKRCAKCWDVKPAEQFPKAASRRDGLRGSCRDCFNRSQAIYSASHPRNDHYIKTRPVTVRKYYDANKAVIAAYRREWAVQNKQRVSVARRRHRVKNPDQNCAQAAKRRAAKLNATPPWADLDEIKRIYAEAARVTKQTGVVHHVDHIVPLCGKNVCGLHAPHNLQILTAIENCKKNNRV